MEDEIRKRNTDCVYYLASTLACKKGNECEYRHSESARFNPRDCWYWLNSKCLNPQYCAFRHPPLEGLSDAFPKLVQSPPVAAGHTDKINVPCYFYFNAYCIKGDYCPFLHGTFSTQKVLAPTFEVTTNHPLKNRTSDGSDRGPASVKAANPSEGTPELIKHCSFEEVLYQPLPESHFQEHGPYVESLELQHKQRDLQLSSGPLPTSGHTSSSRVSSPERCSEEQAEGCGNSDEFQESSPGFDVLVEDPTEPLAYRDERDYLFSEERELNVFDSYLFHPNFKDQSGYEAMAYPDAEYDLDLYDPYDSLGTFNPDYGERASEHSREKTEEPMLHRERRPFHMEHRVDSRDDIDLRHHLRKPSVDRFPVRRNSLKQGFNLARGNSREPLVSDRISSVIRSSYRKIKPSRNNDHRRGWLEGSLHSNRHSSFSRREKKGKRRHGSRVSSSNKVIPSQVTSASFPGPKTISEIKEEKARARADGGSSMLDSPF